LEISPRNNAKYIDIIPEANFPAQERYYLELVFWRLQIRIVLANPAFQCGAIIGYCQSISEAIQL
jgi:hypothetical protein